MGSTPCGLDRETCIKCADGKLPPGTCDTNCNDIVAVTMAKNILLRTPSIDLRKNLLGSKS